VTIQAERERIYRTFKCRTCGAGIGEVCASTYGMFEGSPKKVSHAARWYAAQAALHLPLPDPMRRNKEKDLQTLQARTARKATQ
jgi:hypothetical protein